MMGFRTHPSTPGILLTLKEGVLVHIFRHSTTAVLALDLNGALHDVSYDAFLGTLKDTNCRKQMVQPIQTFLLARKAYKALDHYKRLFKTSPTKKRFKEWWFPQLNLL